MSFFIEPYDDCQQYTTFTSDIDLTSTAQSSAAVIRGHARGIRVDVVGSGTLALVFSGSGGTTRTFTVTAGWELTAAKILTIKSTTNVSRVTVGW